MLLLLGIGTSIALACFAFTWLVSVRIKNYGLLDVAFSYGIAVLAPIYALGGPGNPLRKGVFALVGVAWSLRLGTYLLFRVLKHHPEKM
jgi:steroid 5-alpha reductase family enzyme